MTGLMEYNPAVAGKSLDISAAALFKNQWSGFEGAPRAQIISAHKPILIRSFAVGGSVRSVFSKSYTSFGIDANLAYRLRFSRVQLHLVSKFSGTFVKTDFSSLETNESDPVFESVSSGKLIPNVGFGAYFFTE
ncbi:MAG: type IX secretion system PorP/SprF family membrane protein [Flavobacteriales bacterium]|jgi:type IX secretion system PorP/SprF family membrane protein